MYGPYDHGWMFGSGFGMAFGGLWMILFWLAIILLLFALFRHLLSRPQPGDGMSGSGPDGKTPLDILKEAYARGDISREEFLQKRDDLLER